MEGAGKAKKRSPNFSPNEKDVLLNSVLLHKSVIENKKTDAVTWRQKHDVWQEIEKEFNSKSPGGVYRTAEALKKCYDNLKKEGRKKATHNRNELRKTGGGVADIKGIDNENLLLSIINEKTVFGLHNPFDNDSMARPSEEETNRESSAAAQVEHTIVGEVLPDGTVQVPVTEIDRETINVEQENEAGQPVTQVDWGDYRVGMLKTPLNKKLEEKKGNSASNSTWTSRRRPIATSLSASKLSEEYSAVANLKREIAKYTLENLQEEHEQKRVEHQLRVECLQLDIALKKRKLENFRSNVEY